MLSIHADTSHVIQLAVGPAFMLAAIGGTLTVLTNRLARVNDRTLKRKEDAQALDAPKLVEVHKELDSLRRRAQIITAAIAAGASCAILVCVLIGSLFVGNELEVPFDRFVAILFVLAMLGMIATYTLFLVEIFLAERSINPT